MSDNLVMSAWAPGLIGFAVSGLMYGVTLGQSIHYARCFPHDSRALKLLVFTVFLADTAHLVGGTQFYWVMLISCHRKYSWSCENAVPWGGFFFMVLDFIITFAVQCFYCHRIWIISGRNKCVTAVILSVAILGIGFGAWYSVESILSGSIRFVFTSRVRTLDRPGLNTVNDFVITGAVFKYMWRAANSELRRRRRGTVQDLAIIFINVGAFTCCISIVLGIMYLAQGDGYLVSAVGILLSRSYVNSMLAVLNARRRIRDRTAVMSFELSRIEYSFS